MYGAGIPGSTKQLTKRMSNRKRRQLMESAIEYGMRARLILIACLAQSGGQITITKGTINQAGVNLAHLDYAVTEGANENESIVKLIDTEKPKEAEEVTVTPSLTITKIPDEEGSCDATPEIPGSI